MADLLGRIGRETERWIAESQRNREKKETERLRDTKNERKKQRDRETGRSVHNPEGDRKRNRETVTDTEAYKLLSPKPSFSPLYRPLILSFLNGVSLL